MVVEEYQKGKTLYSILEKEMDGSRVLIFVQTKRAADDLTRRLRNDGWPARAIHGDKTQGERDYVLQEFREGKSPLLIATDVASRGLDVKDIKVVINYDFPSQMEDYVHRIGRTGRAGTKGHAISLFTLGDTKKARELIDVLKSTNQYIPPALEKFASHMSGSSMGRYRGGGRGGGGASRFREQHRDRDGDKKSYSSSSYSASSSSSSSYGSYGSASSSHGSNSHGSSSGSSAIGPTAAPSPYGASAAPASSAYGYY